MTKYVALLRGIAPSNPNMHNEKLRDVFENLGFTNVRTVISSGNVLFETPLTNQAALEAMIEEALPAQLGFQSTTIIRSLGQLQQLTAADPFKGRAHNPGSYLTVTFLKHKSANVTSSLQLPINRGYQIIAVYDREICNATDTTLTKTPDLMTQLEKQLGKEITTRTWKTVERILKNLGTPQHTPPKS